MASKGREHAHDLIDRLEPDQLAAVVHLLETILPRDETLSTADRQAVAEADAWLERNDPIPHAQVLAEFGLTEADWQEMAREPRTRNG